METRPELPALLLFKILSAVRVQCSQWGLRVQSLQTPVYHYNQNADAQHKIAAVEVVAGDVFDAQFKLRAYPLCIWENWSVSLKKVHGNWAMPSDR